MEYTAPSLSKTNENSIPQFFAAAAFKPVHRSAIDKTKDELLTLQIQPLSARPFSKCN